MDSAEFKQIIAAQDDLIKAAGVDIWVGMEPTFTRRFAESPEWLSEALGPEKLGYAYQLVAEARRRQPGGVILHTLGRQYGGEERPRWSIGYYLARQRQFTWDGPPDPIIEQQRASAARVDIELFWQALNAALRELTWESIQLRVEGNLKYRLLFRIDGKPIDTNIKASSKVTRASVHDHKIPLNGLVDELAQEGYYLLCLADFSLDPEHADDAGVLIELPAMPTVEMFLQLLQAISQASKQIPIPGLVLQGFPPPVDASIAWTTITPDPAVIEINQAPEPDATHFFDRCRLFYEAAQQIDLYPYRLQYNGVVSDSGGGGQFTIGGTDPLSSPFIRYPQLLPRLIRYFNAHPALSYWFAPPSIGSSSQSPRVDEGLRDAFNELVIAMEQLEKIDSPSAESIWRCLSPFLVDPSGNPHRSELNIEKLWNPYLPGRGCLGLVEFRAFRMSRSAECATAIAVLLRSIVTMLIVKDMVPELIDYHARLHTQYALPFYMKKDMQAIFNDLEQSSLPLHNSLQGLLLQEPIRFIGKAVFHDCFIELQQAVEFWPLVGDVASQERGGSRMIDASTARLQISLGIETSNPLQLHGWEVLVDGYRIPMHEEQDQDGPIRISAVRYRNFQPFIGLHPEIPARSQIRFLLTHRELEEALEVTYHEWQPQGLPYDGLPVNMDDAEQRRSERFTTRIITKSEYQQSRTPPSNSLSDYCLDLRRLPG